MAIRTADWQDRNKNGKDDRDEPHRGFTNQNTASKIKNKLGRTWTPGQSNPKGKATGLVNAAQRRLHQQRIKNAASGGRGAIASGLAKRLPSGEIVGDKRAQMLANLRGKKGTGVPVKAFNR